MQLDYLPVCGNAATVLSFLLALLLNLRYLEGTLVSSATLGRTLMLDPSAQPAAFTQFAIPMFCLSGARDHFTPADAAAEYFETIDAPIVDHLVFEDSGHYPNEDEPERFLEVLLGFATRALEHAGDARQSKLKE